MPARDPPGSVPPRVEDSSIVLDQFFPIVYDELRRVAHRHLRDEVTGHTLGTTALVHEVYLRMARHARKPLTDRAHFFALASRAMRQVLIDSARRYRTARRGGGQVPATLDEQATVAATRADTMVELDEALDRLGAIEPRLARVVECRFFAGLSEDETAEALAVTARTVRRDWVKAKEWLYRELDG